MRPLLREPLLRFFLLGGGIYALGHLLGAAGPSVAPDAEVQRALRLDLEAQLGRSPSPGELEAAVERWIDDEVLLREARARRLGDRDPVVRRRLIQSMRLILEAEAGSDPGPAPRQAGLLLSFEHVFSKAPPPADWAARLERGERALGVAFPLGRSVRGRPAEWVRSTFGPELAEGVLAAPLGRWTGPVRSAFGYHFLRVEQRESSAETRAREVPAERADALRRELLALRARYGAPGPGGRP